MPRQNPSKQKPRHRTRQSRRQTPRKAGFDEPGRRRFGLGPLDLRRDSVSLEELLSTRARMLSLLHRNLMQPEKEMILRFLRSEVFWNDSGFAGIEDLPALLWKTQNLDKMAPEKRAKSIQELEGLLAEGVVSSKE